MGKRSARREEARRKLNMIKVTFVLVIISITVFCIWFGLMNNDTDKLDKEIAKEDIENIYENEIVIEEMKDKTVEEVVTEFGGSIIEKVKPDTCYVSKGEKEYTVYSDGEIQEGRAAIWDGSSTEPQVNEDGSIDIILPSELKWVADKVISGEKNFAGITITLKESLDLGARKTENGWEGPNWTSIVGYLDELPEQEENQNKVVDDSIVVDDTMDVVQENLKRFAGTFNANGKIIRGMKIESDKSYQGLFGYLSGNIYSLTIKNSYVKGNSSVGIIAGYNTGHISNCRIVNSEVEGNSKVGLIAGASMTGSTIAASSVEGKNSISKGEEYIGGILGYANNNVNLENLVFEGQVEGNKHIGGIAGICFYGTTLNSMTNLGKVVGEENVGGLVGYSQGQIEKSYSGKIGSIQGNKNVGGLVGLNHTMGDINNSYNESLVVGKEDNIGGIVGINSSNVSNVYNTGKIDATLAGMKTGGICGQNSSESYIKSSYNTGIIDFNESAEGIVGVDFGNTSNSYYLDTSLDNPAADKTYSKTNDEMKALIVKDLGELFTIDSNNFNNGYPILTWTNLK